MEQICKISGCYTMELNSATGDYESVTSNSEIQQRSLAKLKNVMNFAAGNNAPRSSNLNDTSNPNETRGTMTQQQRGSILAPPSQPIRRPSLLASGGGRGRGFRSSKSSDIEGIDELRKEFANISYENEETPNNNHKAAPLPPPPTTTTAAVMVGTGASKRPSLMEAGRAGRGGMGRGVAFRRTSTMPAPLPTQLEEEKES